MGKIFRFKPTGHFFAFGRDMHGAATKAKFVTGEAQFESNLSAKVIRGAQFDENGQYIEGTGEVRKIREYLGSNWIQRLWFTIIYRNKTVLDLGSGLITNVAALALANDFNWAAPSGAAINVLKLCNWHATGTGTTSAAATDIKLQTVSTNGGQTPVAGTQTLVSAANVQKLQTVATISYTGSEAVTEWGLFNSSTLSTNTSIGTPFTATTATSATVTGTPLTASSSTVQGKQQFVVSPDTTAVWGLVTSNTTSVYTIPAWYKVSDGTAGSTPGSTEAYHLLALMLDHKVFSAINVGNGDSIQFTYQLTVSSGT